MTDLLILICVIIVCTVSGIIIIKSENEREKLEKTIKDLGFTPIWKKDKE